MLGARQGAAVHTHAHTARSPSRLGITQGHAEGAPSAAARPSELRACVHAPYRACSQCDAPMSRFCHAPESHELATCPRRGPQLLPPSKPCQPVQTRPKPSSPRFLRARCRPRALRRPHRGALDGRELLRGLRAQPPTHRRRRDVALAQNAGWFTFGSVRSSGDAGEGGGLRHGLWVTTSWLWREGLARRGDAGETQAQGLRGRSEAPSGACCKNLGRMHSYLGME